MEKKGIYWYIHNSYASTNYVFDTGEAGGLADQPIKAQMSTNKHEQAQTKVIQAHN